LKRLRLFEIHERPGCPASLRDAVTDYLQFLAGFLGYFRSVIPLLCRSLDRSDTRNLVDLAAGGGGPWLGMLRRGAEELPRDWSVLLTDLYPNLPAFRRASLRSSGRISFRVSPVDATRVPPDCRGMRTVFGALHHFTDAEVTAMIRDAARRREAFASFEPQERRPLSMLSILAIPLAAWLTMPFVRPFRWSRLFWTYPLPIAPLILGFDGIVSCMRTHSPEELRFLVDDAGVAGYRWETGRVRMRGLPLRITYLVGAPRDGAPLA